MGLGGHQPWVYVHLKALFPVLLMLYMYIYVFVGLE